MKQEEYFGTGSIENLRNILLRQNVKKIFLVTGKNSFTLSGAEKIFEKQSDVFEIIRFSDFTENPKIEDIEKGITEFKKSKCEAVIAVGGGSVIDTAKSINILAGQEGNPEKIIEGNVKITNKGKTFIAVPTTSGAGSEATHFAVVYMDRNKYSIAHENILPDIVIIDPELTYSLTPITTAISGIDALCQSVESYWSIYSNEESKKYSEESIKLILDNLEISVNNPTDESRIRMSRAANLAGKAINITKTTAPHAISYSMTTYFGVPHGQAVSISLGEFLEYNYGVTKKDYTGSGNFGDVISSMENLIKLFGSKDIKEAKVKIRKLMQSIGLKTNLSELNIKSKEDLKLIIDNINLERLQNNPRIVSKAGLEKILNNIL